ncbi:hypothetical protein ACVCIH_17780 [Burkholderia glumae]|uniref:hypothetical protein n=1 Tax=Burkholderia glumae TaxID=337 RepID=UPI002037260F|nr:hypothetical protein [Burkholderia glumae]MCM2493287.1 hypothetical protein [Burkholderia glumae]MCM2546169.1 hypothetical protein [Burkholderia glumae]
MELTEVLERMHGQINALEIALIAAVQRMPDDEKKTVASHLRSVDAHMLYTDASDAFVDSFRSATARIAKRL